MQLCHQDSGHYRLALAQYKDYMRCLPSPPPPTHYSVSLAPVQDKQAESLPLWSKAGGLCGLGELAGQ